MENTQSSDPYGAREDMLMAHGRCYLLLRSIYRFLKQFIPFLYLLNPIAFHYNFKREHGTLFLFLRKQRVSLYPRGVNLMGYIDTMKGAGEAARLVSAALSLADWPYVVNRLTEDPLGHSTQNQHGIKENPYSINLIRTTAERLPFLRLEKGSACFKNRYNIGCWDWELEEFPDKWLDAFKLVQEIWVVSDFVYSAISKVSPVPVIKMPFPIAVKKHAPQYGRAYFKLPEDAYIFFFMFDFDSVFERKNPEAVIKAFQKSFSTTDNVFLVIKTCNANRQPEKYQALTLLVQKNKSILLFDDALQREKIAALIQVIDCYVSLHRSEGFGLTIAEAMSYGKPVIATAYSGNMDFMTPNTSFLVNYRLTELVEDYDPYEKGCFWAEPDIEHAAAHMRYVYENQENAKIIGEKAREHIAENFNPVTIAKLYQERLDNIARFTGMQ